MENATKALAMAGGLLISLMILGILLLAYNGVREYQASNERNVSDNQVVEFNNQFSTYDRQDVRGSDVYSLLNRAIDYNARKSTSGITTDARESIAFEPIVIKIDFDGKINGTANPFSVDGTKRLIKLDDYEISNTNNTFDDQIRGTVDAIEGKYGQESATNLVIGITKIFISDTSSENKKKEAILSFNIASTKVTLPTSNSVTTNWNTLKTYKEDIYTYYEYVQFKRARFKCEKVEYNKETGRIVEMDFKFTGKIQ